MSKNSAGSTMKVSPGNVTARLGNADSTRSPQKTNLRRAESLARALTKDRPGPRGSATGMRMIQFYLDRAGENLTTVDRSELEMAKEILRRQMQDQPAAK